MPSKIPPTATNPPGDKVGSPINNWTLFPPMANEAPIPISVPAKRCFNQCLILEDTKINLFVCQAAKNIPSSKAIKKLYCSNEGQLLTLSSSNALLS